MRSAMDTRTIVLLGFSFVVWAWPVAGRSAILGAECFSRATNVVLRWQSAGDARVVGFLPQRLDPSKGTYVPLDPCFVDAGDSLDGDRWYEAVDDSVGSGRPGTYRIVEALSSGAQDAGSVFTPLPASGLSSLVAPSGPVPEVVMPSVQAAGARIKIQTEGAGLWRLPSSLIASNLVGATVESVVEALSNGNFRLTSHGQEVAWTALADASCMVFHATAVTQGPYTRRNYYWLEPGPGTVMATASPPVPAAVTGQVFHSRMHFEQDASGEVSIFFDEGTDPETDIFFWTTRTTVASNGPPVSKSYSLFIPGAEAGSGSLGVELKGFSTDSQVPTHRARVYLNNVLLGSVDWVGNRVCAPVFAATNWVAGTNTVKVEGYVQAGDPQHAFFVDSFDVACSRTYMAAGNVLSCVSDSNAVITAGGFTRPDISVFDVTDTLFPVRISGASLRVDSVSGGAWQVSFESLGPSREYWVGAGDAPLPASASGRPVTDWGRQGHGGTHVVLYPAAMKDQALALVAYRRSNGVDSVGIDIEELYDEFAEGVPTPHAFRSFFRAALTNWSPAPCMAVFAGNGNWDYRGLRGETSDPCWIPPIMMCSPSGLVSSDTPIGDVDGDHIPEVVIGRLPALTTNDLQAIVDKIRAVEQMASSTQAVATTADVVDTNGLGAVWGNFHQLARQVVEPVNTSYGRWINEASTETLALNRESLIGQLNAARTLTVFFGHGTDRVLGASTLLGVSGLARLTNAAPGLLMALTCQFGRFSTPYTPPTDGLGEQLVRKAAGGAVGVLASAALSFSDDDLAIGRRVVYSCFRRDGIRLGEALREALTGFTRDPAYKAWALDAFTLMGDPALDMGFRNGEAASYELWATTWFTEAELADLAISGPDADPDGDGLSNGQERMAGTRPRDAGSAVRIDGIHVAADGARSITWTSATNRMYQIEWSPRLDAPFALRQAYVEAVPPRNRFAEGPLPVGMSNVFYRVKVIP